MEWKGWQQAGLMSAWELCKPGSWELCKPGGVWSLYQAACRRWGGEAATCGAVSQAPSCMRTCHLPPAANPQGQITVHATSQHHSSRQPTWAAAPAAARSASRRSRRPSAGSAPSSLLRRSCLGAPWSRCRPPCPGWPPRSGPGRCTSWGPGRWRCSAGPAWRPG
jgi:hypothetical protein